MDIRLAGLATELPPHVLTLEDLKAALTELYGQNDRFLRRLHRIVDSTGIQQRSLCAPADYLKTPRPLGETSEVHLRKAVPLAEAAARRALDEAGIDPGQIDLVLTTSCTGVPIPSIDADLIDLLGMRSDVIRLPITQMGCAGGAVGLARASEILRGIGGGTALTVAVELPSLTFQRDDVSMANMISTCIFGDGAAAAVLTTEAGPGIVLEERRSFHFPDSRHLMGFELEDGGFHIVLDREVPDRIRDGFPPVLESFLQDHGHGLGDLRFHALHPGGHKILKAIEEKLGLGENGATDSRAVLRDVGNLSSATVLFVLRRILDRDRPAPGEVGLLAAFGPGFMAEMQLWRMQ